MKEFLWTLALVDTARALFRLSGTYKEQKEKIERDATISEDKRKTLLFVNAGVYFVFQLVLAKLFQVSLKNVLRRMQ